MDRASAGVELVGTR